MRIAERHMLLMTVPVPAYVCGVQSVLPRFTVTDSFPTIVHDGGNDAGGRLS